MSELNIQVKEAGLNLLKCFTKARMEASGDEMRILTESSAVIADFVSGLANGTFLIVDSTAEEDV